MDFSIGFRSLLLTLVTLGFLGGCGGGGDSVPSIEDIDKSKSRVDKLYIGISEPASVSYANVSHWMDLMVQGSGAFSVAESSFGGSVSSRPAAETLIGQSHDEILKAVSQKLGRLASRTVASKQFVDEETKCYWGASRIKGEISEVDYSTILMDVSITFDGCRIGNSVFDGRIDLVRVVYDYYAGSDGQFLKGVFIFRDLIVDSETSDLKYDGVIELKSFENQWQQHEEYASRFLKEAKGSVLYLLVSDIDTGRMIKYENFSHVNFGYESESQYYRALFGKADGRIYQSDLGYIDVFSLGGVGLVHDHSYLSGSWVGDVFFPNLGGVSIKGRSGNEIRFLGQSGGRLKLEFSIDGDESDYVVPWLELWGEASGNFSDSDDDGMIDSWEVYFGLDPELPATADQDSDADGFTDMEEFRGWSNPVDAAQVPDHFDFRVSPHRFEALDPRIGVIGKEYRYNFTLSVEPGENNTGAIKAMLVTPRIRIASGFIVKKVMFRGESLSFICSETAGVQSCEIGPIELYVQRSTTSDGFTVVLEMPEALAAGIYTVETEVGTDFPDAQMENNVFQFDLDVISPFIDVGINGLEFKDGVYYSESIVAVRQAQKFSAVLFFDEPVNSPETDAEVTVEIDLPDGVNYVPPAPESQSADWDCQGGRTIVCKTNSIFNVNQYGLRVYLEFSGVPKIGPSYFNSRIFTSLPDPDSGNDEYEVPIYLAKSMLHIQQLIDAAQPGDTVLVPPGNYIGNVDFGWKPISLISESGAQKTYLLVDGTFKAVANKTVDGFVDSAVSGFTFLGNREFGANLDFVGVNQFSGNIIDGLGRSDIDISFKSWGDTLVSIDSNVVRGLRGLSSLYLRSTALVINNLFINDVYSGHRYSPELRVWYESGSALINSANSSILNNVFYGGFALDIGKPLIIMNNIFADSALNSAQVSQVIPVVHVTDTVMLDPSTVWRKNLFHNNSANYSYYLSSTGYSDVVSSLPGVTEDLFEDPLFVAPAGGDFHLNTGSPAIDSGISSSLLLTDFDGSARPVDGDGDGVPIIDLGIYEMPAQ